MVTITLPWPPTVNSYYRSPRSGRLAGRTLISEQGRAYRQAVSESVAAAHLGSFTGLVRVTVEAWMPDRRKRDLDNLHKGILDGLTHAGVWKDDSQIDDLRIYRCRAATGELVIEKPGRVVVTIEAI
jgi:crossover junction endodeoxyribonuclease RusA